MVNRQPVAKAYLYRLGGFQPTGERVITGSAWGLNFTGTVLLTDASKFYHQIVFGDGIGSYHGLPDAASESATTDKVLGFTGWMVGYTRDWTDRLNSNFTYAENALDNSLLQSQDDVRGTTYLAANLIWEPVDRVNVGCKVLEQTKANCVLDLFRNSFVSSLSRKRANEFDFANTEAVHSNILRHFIGI